MKVSETETQVYRVEGLMADVLSALGPELPLKDLLPDAAEGLLITPKHKLKFVDLLKELKNLGIVYSAVAKGRTG